MPRDRKPDAASLTRGPVTLYAQLASILRDRIVGGQWPDGTEIPTLDALTREYGIARVTARQAIQMLAAEGLLSSRRGRRTHVTFKEGTAATAPLFSSIVMDGSPDNYSVRILAAERVQGLPERRYGPGRPEAAYMRIRKVDCENGVPYGLSDHYVALAAYKRFPRGAEARIRISRLVLDHAPRRPDAGHERIRVSTLDYDECVALSAPTSMPAARVARVMLAAGKVVHYADYVYRGDRFEITRDISEFLG